LNLDGSREAKLNRVQQIIDVGMPCSALQAARAYRVQFSWSTLNRWYRGRGPRRTSVWLYREEQRLVDQIGP